MEKKINRAERARLFMPFSALKGFEEALREKEKLVEQKKELSEDEYSALNETLQALKPGMNVKITYFNENKYLNIEGEIIKIDFISKTISINKEVIKLESISKIKL